MAELIAVVLLAPPASVCVSLLAWYVYQEIRARDEP